jgi:Tfp pilus assembly protein PilN
MNAIRFDFVRTRRQASMAGLALLCLAGVLATGLGYKGTLLNDEAAALKRDLGALHGRSGLDRYASAQIAGKDLATEIQRANRVIAHLSLPWDELFAALEGSEDYDVALLNVEPDAEKRGLVLTGEAKSLDAMLDFVRYLQEQDCLTDVSLQSHKVNLQDRDKPVRFKVLATWVIA